MDVVLLRTFVVVAETGSFSEAGERLHLTQSTISHQVARLEASIGRRLFNRTTRSCEITSSGRELLGSARDVVAAFDDLTAQFRPNALRGDIRLGLPDDDHLFAPIMEAIVEFSNEQPGVNVSVTAGLSTTLARWIELGELDLAILREIITEPPQDPMPTDLVWVGGDDWRGGGDGVLPLALIHEPCVYRKTALSTLVEAKRDSRILISCTSLAGVLAAVRASFAVSVVTRQDAAEIGGIHIIESGLPPLPTTALRLKFQGERRTAVARALASKLEHQLTSSKLMAQAA